MRIWVLAAALAATACDNSVDRFKDQLAQEQARKGQQAKDHKLVRAAFDAYLAENIVLEQQFTLISLCGDQSYVAAHKAELFKHFYGFMAEKVGASLSDRRPVRVPLRETEEERAVRDDEDQTPAIVSGMNFLRAEGTYSEIYEVFRMGLITGQSGAVSADRSVMCQSVDQYKVNLDATFKPAPPAGAPPVSGQ